MLLTEYLICYVIEERQFAVQSDSVFCLFLWLLVYSESCSSLRNLFSMNGDEPAALFQLEKQPHLNVWNRKVVWKSFFT